MNPKLPRGAPTALETEIRRIAREEARRMLAELQRGDLAYTSSAPPHGVSRRAFNGRCRSGKVEGASFDRSARQWSCTREAWLAAASRRPPPALRVVADEDDLEAQADVMLAASGLRATRRSA